MGIFGGGYLKPGKGVSKNEPKKKGFFLFFDVIIHKFSKFMGANTMLTLTSLIWVFILYIFGGILFTGTGIADNIANILTETSSDMDFQTIYSYSLATLQFMFATAVFSLWGSGPSSAAYAYINRSFTRGEHAWIMSDGVDKFKENFKKGAVVVIVDAVILVLGTNAVYFYGSLYGSTGSTLWMLLSYITVLVLAIYTMMHPYMYQIMVTFECSIGSMYKNALLITLAKLPGNFFILLAETAVIVLLFLVIHPVVAMLAIMIIGLIFTRYPGEFYAARVIEKTILKDMKAKKPQIEYIEEDE